MSTILVAKNLIKEYGNKGQIKALNDVSLEINEGDFIGIMGPSGSGKSTFLNMIATVDKPTKGKVIIDGTNVTAMGEGQIAKFRYENIGFIFQEFNLIDSLTLRENIGVPLVLASKSKEEIKVKVEGIAKKLDIYDYLDKFPVECSGGQRQRAAAARALVTNPKLIVADEPTGNLDTKNSHELLNFLKELNDNEGITILMVTHDSMIASYTKKLVFLRDGKIEEVLDKGDKDQKEFFYDIVDVTSKETQNLFNIMKK
ncbi:ABC transporter ATP-binding protein [Clostridium paraputrificum]|uniref:ABC transporter ATP-binding protein n=1 Tax=Clostridium TaxID=1485 RepID=UPI003D33C4A5